jgi:hypothetical protein
MIGIKDYLEFKSDSILDMTEEILDRDPRIPKDEDDHAIVNVLEFEDRLEEYYEDRKLRLSMLKKAKDMYKYFVAEAKEIEAEKMGLEIENEDFDDNMYKRIEEEQEEAIESFIAMVIARGDKLYNEDDIDYGEGDNDMIEEKVLGFVNIECPCCGAKQARKSIITESKIFYEYRYVQMMCVNKDCCHWSSSNAFDCDDTIPKCLLKVDYPAK